MPTAPERSTNTRTPSLDLDSVYGGGPDTSPQLYDPSDRIKFRVEHGGAFEDLPRSANSRAIIADPRNDENMMISGPPGGLPALPQPRRRYDSRGWPQSHWTVNRRRRRSHLDARRDTRGRRAAKRLRQGPPRGHLALSVDHRQRVPAADPRRLADARHPDAWAALLQSAARAAEHPGGVSRRGLPLRSQHGPAVVSRQPGWRRRQPAVLRLRLRPGRGGAGRSGRSARRRARTSAFHRLADVLRFRRRPDRQRAPAESDRHQDLDAALQPAARRHCERRRPDLAAAAQSAPPPDVVAAVRPGDCDGR